MLFELCIFLGYAIGLAGKLISGSITYVVVVYILDLIMVTADLILTLRNRRLDKLRNRAAKSHGIISALEWGRITLLRI